MTFSNVLSQFVNQFTEWGNPNRDAIAGSYINSPGYLEKQVLYNAFIQSWIIRRACTFLPINAWAKGGDLYVADAEQETIDAVRWLVLSDNRVSLPNKKALQVKSYFRTAMIEATRTGGCGILMDVEDGLPLDQPVDIANIKSVKGLRLFNRWELTPSWGDFYYSGKLEPDYYRLLSRTNSTVAQIHKSRILPFYGPELPREDLFYLSDGWCGDSLIRQILSAVTKLESASSAVADKMQRFEIPILKIRGLIDKRIQDSFRGVVGKESYDEIVRNRAEEIQKGWSVYRLLTADMDEENLELIAHKFQGVAENLTHFRDTVIAASGLPEFVMWGKHGSGLGQIETGERSAIASLVEQAQSKIMGNLQTLIAYYFLSQDSITKGEIPDNWEWRFNPLWNPTEQEEADKQLSQTQVLSYFVDMGQKLNQPILTAQEIRTSVFGGNEFGGTNIQLDESSYQVENSKPTEPPEPVIDSIDDMELLAKALEQNGIF
jgi:phage-related protein (TIGR01555 family)